MKVVVVLMFAFAMKGN